jgi:acetylornithine deacetylase
MTGVSDDEQRVLDLIDVDDLVEIAQSLIAAPGENPPGGEAATVAALQAVAEQRGLVCRRSPVEPERDNLTVTLAGGSGPGLLLLGHTDVVPVGEGWTVSPTGGLVRDGRLYGRGATDMKGGLAACVVAMDALRRAGVELTGPVDLAATVDEEDTGKGIRHYLSELIGERGSEGAATAYTGCVVAEPTDLQTIVAARGDAYLQIRVTGRAAHSGNPADGANAIYGAAAVIGELERWHSELAVQAHPLVGPPTWSVGLIDGGTGASIVAAEATVVTDRRTLPAEQPDVVLEEAQRRVAALDLGARGLSAEVTMTMDMPGFETPGDGPFVVTVDAAIGAAGGPGLPLGGWTAACDGGYVARDLGIPVVVLGPGSVQTQAHRADESVGIDELLTSGRAYVLMALRLLR